MSFPAKAHTTKERARDSLRRWFLGLLVVAFVAAPSALWTERRAISRRIASARLRGGTYGFVTLEQQEVVALSALAAALGGLPPNEPSFAAYAQPLIRRAAERIPGAGFAMRETLEAIAADPDGPKAIDRLLEAPQGWRRFSPSARSAHADVQIAERLLRRVALTSPQSWARLGYAHFPGVLGPMTDYLSPPEPRRS